MKYRLILEVSVKDSVHLKTMALSKIPDHHKYLINSDAAALEVLIARALRLVNCELDDFKESSI